MIEPFISHTSKFLLVALLKVSDLRTFAHFGELEAIK